LVLHCVPSFLGCLFLLEIGESPLFYKRLSGTHHGSRPAEQLSFPLGFWPHNTPLTPRTFHNTTCPGNEGAFFFRLLWALSPCPPSPSPRPVFRHQAWDNSSRSSLDLRTYPLTLSSSPVTPSFFFTLASPMGSPAPVSVHQLITSGRPLFLPFFL